MRLVLDGHRVVVDEAGTRPGRGAWLHPEPDCWEKALKRRSIGRALRVPAADVSQLPIP